VFENKQLTGARNRAQKKKKGIEKSINNLLDNIIETNRELVDKELSELKEKLFQVQNRLEELDRPYLSQSQIDNIVTDAMEFLCGLEFALLQGLPQTKFTALRQCVERVRIDIPAKQIKVALRLVPAGNLRQTKEFKATV
jgi:hypothetical protein